jgi:hypothetical protein
MAAASIIGVMVMVMREHQETEEWYVPPKPGSVADEPKKSDAAGE